MVGLAVPLLPTTIFWILAALCFARSAPEMYRRIVGWPGIGQAVDDFLSRGALSRRSKLSALAGMAAAACLVAILPLGGLATALALGGILVGASFVLTRPGPSSRR